MAKAVLQHRDVLYFNAFPIFIPLSRVLLSPEEEANKTPTYFPKKFFYLKSLTKRDV